MNAVIRHFKDDKHSNWFFVFFISLLLVTKLAALIFYYQAPINILVKLLFLIELLFIFKFIKSAFKLSAAILVWTFLYFSPISVDRKVVQFRYELIENEKTNNFNMLDGTRTTLYVSNFFGEQLSLTKHDRNYVVKFSSKIDEDGCFLETTPIRGHFSLDFEVCPDARGGVWASSKFLDFRNN